jgi:cytochrome c-type biogenesis protein CcmE
MNRKLGTILLLTGAVGALTYIATADLGENLVYYWSPSEMMAQGETAKGATIRLGGLIEAGSIEQAEGELRFKVSDGKQAVLVRSNGTPPQMFREGIGVVVEGTLASDGSFACKRIMVKHDENYAVPADGTKPDAATMMEG